MKLASLKSGRDGRLVVVSNDLQRYLPVADVAAKAPPTVGGDVAAKAPPTVGGDVAAKAPPTVGGDVAAKAPPTVGGGLPATLQAALDNWSDARPALEELSARVNAGEGESFDQSACHSPLPRAYQWADGSAYVNHVELVRKARGAEMPDSFWTDPLMYQGGSDSFLAPYDNIPVADEAFGIDFEAEIVVATDDVPMGVSPEDALEHIQLVMLVNDVSLRGLIPAELAKGFGFFQSKPSSAFSPVAVTPDELGDAWRDGKLHLPLLSFLNDEPFGKPDAGIDMTFHFGQLVAHAAKTRPLCAGSLIGSGTISNKLDGGPGRPIAEGGVGYSCIAEIRTIETINDGKPATAFMRFGDRVRIEMNDANGASIFGTIEQTVEQYEGP